MLRGLGFRKGGYIGAIYWVYIGMMENKMETTI